MGLALTKLTVTDVVSQVKSIGTAYHQYEEGIISNSIDGRTLFLLQEEDIADCFRAVGVVNKLHWIKLKLHFQDLASGRHNINSSSDQMAIDSVPTDNASMPVELCMSVGTMPRIAKLTEAAIKNKDSGSTTSESGSDSHSISSKDGTSITRRGKFRLSCNRCTLYKKKCIGKPRCENCAKHDKECVFNERLRPGPSIQSGISGLGSGAQSRLVSKVKRSAHSVISSSSSSLPVQVMEEISAAPTADAVLLLSSTVFAPLPSPSFSDSDDNNCDETMVVCDSRIAPEYYQSEYGNSIGSNFNAKSSFGYV